MLFICNFVYIKTYLNSNDVGLLNSGTLELSKIEFKCSWATFLQGGVLLCSIFNTFFSRFSLNSSNAYEYKDC